MRFLLLLLMAFPSASFASPDWERVDKRSEITYKASNYAILGGLIVSLGGSFSSQPALQTTGNLVATASMATMAGSSLRQRRSIVERGVKLSPAWGYTSWGLQGASLGLGAGLVVFMEKHNIDATKAPPSKHQGAMIGMSLGSLACTIGAILTASKQHKENAYKRSLIGRADHNESTQHFAMQVSPYFTPEGSAGLSASAIF